MRSKRRIFFLLIFIVLANGALGRNLEFRKEVRNYHIDVKLDRNPPVIGENGIEVKITDPWSRPVTDAKVWINYYMPPMPRMAPMNYKIEAKPYGEKYRANMSLIMSGPWIIAIKIMQSGNVVTAKVNIDVQ